MSFYYKFIGNHPTFVTGDVYEHVSVNVSPQVYIDHDAEGNPLDMPFNTSMLYDSPETFFRDWEPADPPSEEAEVVEPEPIPLPEPEPEPEPEIDPAPSSTDGTAEEPGDADIVDPALYIPRSERQDAAGQEIIEAEPISSDEQPRHVETGAIKLTIDTETGEVVDAEMLPGEVVDAEVVPDDPQETA